MTNNYVTMHLQTSIGTCIHSRSTDTSLLSVGQATGLSTVVTFILTMVIGLVLGMALMYCIMSAKRTNKYAVTGDESSHMATLPTASVGPVYEDVCPAPKEDIELKSNQAYGPIGQ